MGFVQEFKEFASKGNVVDMAVGLVIGAGFGKIVSSVVEDIIMPPIGMILGGVDFTGLKFTLKEAVDKVPAVTVNYGKFIQTSFDFLIVAFAMFMVIKGMNALKKNQAAAAPAAPSAPAAPAAPTTEENLLTEIRDILKALSPRGR